MKLIGYLPYEYTYSYINKILKYGITSIINIIKYAKKTNKYQTKRNVA